MAYKKHNWMPFGHSNNEIVEITMRDGSGRRLDSFRCNNQQDYRKILFTIYKSYGLSPNGSFKDEGDQDKENNNAEDKSHKEELDFLNSM